MAGLVMVAGMIMINRHRDKKEAKAQKKIYDDLRFSALQRETEERLAQSSINSSAATTPITQRGSIFDSPTVEAQAGRSSEDSASIVTSLPPEKLSRRVSWFGGNKEGTSKGRRLRTWRSSMMIRS